MLTDVCPLASPRGKWWPGMEQGERSQSSLSGLGTVRGVQEVPGTAPLHAQHRRAKLDGAHVPGSGTARVGAASLHPAEKGSHVLLSHTAGRAAG